MRKSGLTSACTTTIELAGGSCSSRYSFWAWRAASMSASGVRKTVTFTMSESFPPTDSMAVLRLALTWRACASVSPFPTTLPSAARAVWPAIQTRLPDLTTWA